LKNNIQAHIHLNRDSQPTFFIPKQELKPDEYAWL